MPLSDCGCQDHEIEAAQNLQIDDPDEFAALVAYGAIDLNFNGSVVWVSRHAVTRFYDEPDEDDDGGRTLQYHGYRPHLIFHGDGPMYLGMELEIEIPERRDEATYAGRLLKSVKPDVIYFQEDGTIRHGFEMTTHPMSYPWAMEHFPWELLTRMEEDGCSTHHGVGLHIHVSRAAFDGSECHLYRWLKFIYRNERQAKVLGRRSNDEWASFHPDHRQAIKYMIKQEDMRRGYDRHGNYTPAAARIRYQAVNPLNADTLEVRFFASSVRPTEVKAALGFVASTVEYTRRLDANQIIRNNGWAWSAYVDWLRQEPQRDVYRPVLDELEALSCVS